jgi:hypothetical protein
MARAAMLTTNPSCCRQTTLHASFSGPTGIDVVAPGLRLLGRSATICDAVVCLTARMKGHSSIYVRDFNVALGVEAQGFCVLK